MARRNRVSPFGAIEVSPAKGLFLGNRGILVDANGEIRRPHAHRNWVCCTLVPRNGGTVRFDSPDHYTPLFFWDEAVALSAGHRPCAQCRHVDYKAFKAAFAIAAGGVDAATLTSGQMDAMLHADRIDGRQKRTFRMALSNLPSGCFFTQAGRPEVAFLWHGDKAYPWSHSGYGAPVALDPATLVDVLTPKRTVATIKAGYEPQLRLGLGAR